jgi:sigma-B regulation protein RsbU (phosphoserine phosphatase)
VTAATSGDKQLHIDPFEMQLAREVERLLFPRSSPVCDWNCIGVKNRTAGVLGGDYFDFATLPDGCQAVFIGDVTGHGLHASLVMSLIYGFIHRAALDVGAPSELAAQVNDFLLHFAERSRTMDQYFSTTLFFAVIDPRTLAMEYVNAGHVPALVRRGGDIVELSPTTQPLGFFEALDTTTGSFRLVPGDRLLLYTDGIIEAPGASGERFGPQRLKELLVHGASDHMEFLASLFQTMRSFGTADPPEDDCSALVVDIRGEPPCPG